jgi:hypothetical protein
MISVPQNQFIKPRNRTSIFLWSFGIALGVFFLMLLRIKYLDPYLNDTTDQILFFAPHFFIIIIGAILGKLNSKDSLTSSLRLTQQPFLSMWSGTLIFSVTFALWVARPNHFVQGRSYISDVFSNTILSFFIALFWIVVPFFIGYSLTKFIQYAINYMCHKK